MKTKDKHNKKKYHNPKNQLLFPIIWIWIHLEAKIQSLDETYWNFITQAPMTIFIVHQWMF